MAFNSNDQNAPADRYIVTIATEDPSLTNSVEVDVLVAGSGAGGLSAAVCSAALQLQTLVVEKASKFGGTTATSGGSIWVPVSPHAQHEGTDDTVAVARAYLQACAAKYSSRFDAERIDAYLANGPRMMTFLEQRSRMRFGEVTYFPDYHPEVPGAATRTRMINSAPFDAGQLARNLRSRLRRPWTKITFLGLQVSAGSAEQHHFYHASRSLHSAAYVALLMLKQGRDLALYGHSRRLVNGNGLVAQLAASCHDLNVPIWTSSPAVELIRDEGRVVGCFVERNGTRVRVLARRGVVLATGGFSHDVERRRPLYSHERRGAHHFPIGAEGDAGDGARMAETVGGAFSADVTNAAAWAPVTPVPQRGAGPLNLPHQRTYGKPGAIAVTRRGLRFTNDACSYHDMVQAMVRACADEKDVECFVICDHATLRRYGLGIVVKPYPFPIWPHLRAGYLFKGGTIVQLADRAGIDPKGLASTVERFNGFARDGHDPDFRRGETEFDRCQGDPEVKPNPSLAPIVSAPFYALRLVPGDTGTFAGLRTNRYANVLDRQGVPIPGLYAVGNDMLSIFGGDYPGGGVTIGPALTFGYIAAMHMAGQPIADLSPSDLDASTTPTRSPMS